MKEINIINLDQNEGTLLPQHYNIGFTHFSSLRYPSCDLDGVISFAGSLVEFKEDILIDKSIPVVMLQELLCLLNDQHIDYILHSEAVDFGTKKTLNEKVLRLDITEFDFDIYAIYAVTLNVNREILDSILAQIPSSFKIRMMKEDSQEVELLLNMGNDNLNRSLDMLRHHFK